VGARYSRKAQARVALSVAARQLSDDARGLVLADDRGSGPGEIVERAAQLADQARAVLRRPYAEAGPATSGRCFRKARKTPSGGVGGSMRG
jgi:hypothetical protein